MVKEYMWGAVCVEERMWMQKVLWGDRNLVFDRIQQGLEVLTFRSFGIDGKSRHLKGFEVPVKGPGMTFQLLS